MATNYRNVSNTVKEVDVGENRIMLESGGFIEFSDNDVKSNKILIEDGHLMKVDIKLVAKKKEVTV